jgi:hypothetical protein
MSVSVVPVNVDGDPTTVNVSVKKVSEVLYVNFIPEVFPPFELTLALITVVVSPILLAARIVTVGTAIGVKLLILP